MHINKGKTIQENVEELLKQMTLAEKIGQMNQYNGFYEVTGPAPQEGFAALKFEHLRQGLVGSMLNVKGAQQTRKLQQIVVEESRLGIPLLFAFDVIHGFKTISPIPLAEAASWDVTALEKSARMAAIEASAAGIHWTFAPMVDVGRDARWGRVMEGAGEDPYYGSQVAIARIKGFQGDDLSKPDTIAATAKHFAGYAHSESGRDYNTVDVSINTLYNEIFPPFMASIEAGVKTFMTSFNDLNGIPATADEFLLRKVLKGDWEFEGSVVSDWSSIREMILHGYAKDDREAARLAANAGCDIDMESYGYVNFLEELVNVGAVSEELITDSARRVLTLKYELGLFDDPYKYCDEEREAKHTGSKEMREASLDMAKKSIVLLKNDNYTLPLQPKQQKIAIIGPLATEKTSPLGSWIVAASDQQAVSVVEGMHQFDDSIPHVHGVRLLHDPMPTFGTPAIVNTHDRQGIDEAVELAKQSEVVVMVLGEHAYQSGESRSRTNIDLPGLQQELLEAVYAVNPNIVLVLMNGRPLTIPWAAHHIPAIVEAWQLGSESGNAIAQVLFGEYNPSGKLPMSFPRSVGQIPISYRKKNTGRPAPIEENSVFFSHYTDEQNDALYPFGFGLTYTSFGYSPVTLSSHEVAANQSIEAKVTVTNTGQRKGKDVVQLYIQDLFASTVRPTRELKDFRLVELEAGESKEVVFTIDSSKLQFFNNKEWVVEPGEFNVFVGNDSTTQNRSTFTVIDTETKS